MKFEIMVSILFEMLSKKVVTAKYLSEKYEVSTRSIYRYINSLEYAGIPIYTNRGINGGFSIVDTFKISSGFLTKNEYNQTIEALSAIINAVPNKTISSVIDKLKAITKYDYNDLTLKTGNLIIDAGPWGDTVGYKTKVCVIQNAIENSKKLSIKYHDRNGTVSERTIEPYTIVFKQGLWYVYAFCELRKEFRFFKIGRIEYANTLNETFSKLEINKNDLPLDFWNGNPLSIDVVLEIDKKCLSDAEEWLGIENISNRNNSYIAETKLPNDQGLVSKIMSFGDGIKVISPQDLREKIKENAKLIAEKYK